MTQQQQQAQIVADPDVDELEVQERPSMSWYAVDFVPVDGRRCSGIETTAYDEEDARDFARSVYPEREVLRVRWLG